MSDTIHSSSLIIFCAKKFHITHCYIKQYFFAKKQEEKIRCLCSFLHVGGTWFSSFCFLRLVYHICILYVWLVFTCIDQTINIEMKIVRNDVLKRIKCSNRIIRKYKPCNIYILWYITKFLISIQFNMSIHFIMISKNINLVKFLWRKIVNEKFSNSRQISRRNSTLY